MHRRTDSRPSARAGGRAGACSYLFRGILALSTNDHASIPKCSSEWEDFNLRPPRVEAGANAGHRISTTRGSCVSGSPIAAHDNVAFQAAAITCLGAPDAVILT
jgi:hypothetical protein